MRKQLEGYFSYGDGNKKDLIDCLCDLPGIGEKSAERLALATINLDKSIINLYK